MASAQRPMVLTLAAILALAFGALGLIGSVVNLVTAVQLQSAKPAPLPDNPTTDPFKIAGEMNNFIVSEVPSFPTFQMAATVLGMIAAALLVVTGIGIFKLTKWARPALYAYVALALINTIGGMVYTVANITPAIEKWEAERTKKFKASNTAAPPQTAAIGAYAGLGIQGVCGFGFPLLLVILVMLPSSRGAFAGEAPGTRTEKTYDDELDPDRPLYRGDDV